MSTKNLFVSYAIAMQLKELGFNEPCFAFYLEKSDKLYPVIWKSYECRFINLNSNQGVYAPLFQQAVDWLISKGVSVNVSSAPIYKKHYGYNYFKASSSADGFEVDFEHENRHESLSVAIQKAIDFYLPKKYYYLDNWQNAKKEFTTLYAAVESAKLEEGMSISVFDYKGNCTNVNASGYTAP